MRHVLRLAVLALGVVAASGAWAANFTVNSTDDLPDAIPGNGLCATATGVCTLRAAIQEANAKSSRDTIKLPAGVFVLTLVGPGEDAAATGDLDVKYPATIIGAGAGATIIDGNGAGRVFHLFSSVTLQRLTIRGGNATAELGASCPQRGGGICVTATGAATLSEVVITGNMARYGGGIYSDGALTLLSSHVSSNSATDLAGGILNAGALTFRDSGISGNISDASGGGIWSSGGVTGQRCAVTTNLAALSGGGIYSSGGVTLRDCTVSSNMALTGGGGGILNEGALTLVNATVAANVAPAGTGGGLVNGTGAPGLTAISLASTIVAQNTDSGVSPDCGGVSSIGSLGYNLIGSTLGCTLSGDLTGNLTDVPALLGPLASNGGPTPTHALLVGSPALDAGNPALPGTGGLSCSLADQRGVVRPGGTRCDIGAVEQIPECRDGIDNDGDGLIDYPADPGCTSADDPSEKDPSLPCDDGIDNDGDGLIDYPADPGCASPWSATESPACNDGIDNDGDGLIDYPADPGCASASSNIENPQCDDGIDNDGNGLIDYPADPGCTSRSDPSESSAPACGLGFELAPVLVGLLWLRARRSRHTS